MVWPGSGAGSPGFGGIDGSAGATPGPWVAKWMVPPVASIRERLRSLAIRVVIVTIAVASFSSATARVASALASARLSVGSRPFSPAA